MPIALLDASGQCQGALFPGSSKTILDQDLASIRQGGYVSDLVDRLRLQFHHIFPKSVLKASFTAREADDLAFIGGKTNRAISDKALAMYLPPLVDQLGEAAFAAQCIPVEHRCWKWKATRHFCWSDASGLQRR